MFDQIIECAPLGVFDSGVGGLTVAGEIFRQLPAEEIVYLGDTAHVPYGPRAVEELIGFADEIVDFLISQGAKAIVDACNTTSSVALEFLLSKYDIPIIGVVEPGVKAALRHTVSGRVGVIATEATIMSAAHRRKVQQLEPAVQVYGQACPLFVPLVESGETNSGKVRQVAREYLAPLMDQGIDTLILGCTHYPFLVPVLKEVLGPDVNLVDPAWETVRQLGRLLEEKGLTGRDKGTVSPQHRFYVTGAVEPFREVGQRLLGTGYLLERVMQVTLG
ncbi:glutamate racemase [Clostridiales bacterium PH28_bin88]|nr:glutamate racemase [Clostridiales bacterium PH28_bin88]